MQKTPRCRDKNQSSEMLLMFLSAALAGLAISIGGAVNLASESKFVGASLFSVGLFIVCTFGLNLFTGKICYLLDYSPAYLGNCCIIWLGNLLGTFLAGTSLRWTRLTGIVERGAELSQIKLEDAPVSIFILSIFCNFLIYIAVESYRDNPHQVGKYLGLFFGVTVFVMTGFEHCVANMFYFTVGGAWSLKTLVYLLIMTLGNTVGGLLIPSWRKLKEKAL